MSRFPRDISTQREISALFFFAPIFHELNVQSFFLCASKKFCQILITNVLKSMSVGTSRLPR